MKSLVAVVLSLVYMFVLTLFLSFVAVFVCDGYYPVGWNLKGSALHLAFWAMPWSVLLGSIGSSLAIRHRLAVVVLLFGTIPFVAAIFWQELQTTFYSGGRRQSPWLHAWLLAVLLCIVADVALIRRARAGGNCPNQQLLETRRVAP